MIRNSISNYRGIIGSTQETIDAIQRFIAKNSPETIYQNTEVEETPAASINRILDSTVCEETNSEIQKIINRL